MESTKMEAVVVVIVWLLDLQLNRQSMPITINVVCSNPVHSEVYSVQHYVINFSVTCGRSVAFSRYTDFLHQ
jgi:hypothetical protein